MPGASRNCSRGGTRDGQPGAWSEGLLIWLKAISKGVGEQRVVTLPDRRSDLNPHGDCVRYPPIGL